MRGESLTRIRRSALVVAAAALASCDAPTMPSELPGYDPRLGGTDIYHWPLGHDIAVYVDPAAGGDAFAAPVQSGFAGWRDSLRYREVTMTLVGSPELADVIVHHINAPYLVEPGTCGSFGPGAAGRTFFCVALQGDTLEVLPLVSGASGRVKMNVTIDPSRTTTASPVAAIVAHELGHVLGIGTHSNGTTDLMFAAPTVLVPNASDAATLRWLLHQPPTIRP